MELILVFSTIVTICIIIYLILIRNYDYWEKRGVYFVEPEFLFGNIKERILLKIAYHDFHKKWYFKMKGHRYAGLFEGRSPNLMVLDPELIKQVLVKDFDHYTDRVSTLFRSSEKTTQMLITLKGGEWKNVRAAMTPAFSSGKIKAMLSLVTNCAEQLISRLNLEVEKNDGVSTQPTDVKEVLSKFTLDVIASCAFGVQCDSQSNPNAPFAEQISKFNDIPLWRRFLIFGILICQFPPFISRLFPISFMNEKTVDFLGDVVRDTTHQRRTKNIRRNDFLQLLMDIEICENDPTAVGDSTGSGSSELKEAETENEKTKISEDKVIDEATLVAQCVLFFVAGYETSSTLLAMACYELAKNKTEQDILRKEIQEVLAKHDNQVTYEAILDMPYLEMVLSETLRMYPPVARLDRVCTKTHKLGGLLVEEGSRINISVIGLHYDPDYYPEPDVFNPKRFSLQDKTERSPYVYLPFGIGPRNCIGIRFAKMSTKLCMVYLLREFSVDVCEKTQIPFMYHTRSMLLKAKDGVWLQFSKVSN